LPNDGRWRVQVPAFSRILKVVVALAVLSAVLAAAMAALNAFYPNPLAADLGHGFLEGFKACLFGILGLLGGRAATTGGKSRRH
jgi:hypothetical protein